MPPGIATLPNNKGLEALVFAPRRLPLAGTLIAISERGLDADGNLKAFLIGGPSPASSRSSAATTSTSAIAPCCRRRPAAAGAQVFAVSGGIAMRMRRIALADIKPGAMVDGRS